MSKHLRWLVPVFLLGCASPRLANINFVGEYDSSLLAFAPIYRVWNPSADSTNVYFQVDREQLLFARKTPEASFTASLVLRFYVYESYRSNEILDSTNVHFDIEKDPYNHKPIMGRVALGRQAFSKFYVKILAIDLNKGNKSTQVLEVNKETGNNQQNILPLDAYSGLPCFRNHFVASDSIVLRLRDPATKIHVRYYSRPFGLAPPPFSSSELKPFKYAADSVYSALVNNSNEARIAMPAKGFLHIQAATNDRKGLTLVRFDNDYPKVIRPEMMLEPLQYLTGLEEYYKMKKHANPRMAVEEFWLAHSGSKERARELIRGYYSRVEFANFFFSSYKEGWKTDRGMVYIVYGRPGKVYRDNITETWVYGGDQTLNSQTFHFNRVDNPFSDNHYRLARNQSFRPAWHLAVENWRAGRIVSAD